MRMGVTLLGIVLSGVVVCATGAAAQPVGDQAEAVAASDEGQAEALRLTEVGTRAWERGDHQTALDYFRLAYRIYPSARIDYNIGLALAGLDRRLAAVEAFERFLAGATDAPEENRRYALERITKLERGLAKVIITTSVSGASLSIDGQTTALHEPARVAPGFHSIVVRKAGMKSATADLEVHAGDLIKRRLDPKLTTLQPTPRCESTALPLVPPPKPLGAPSKSPDSRRRAWLTAGAIGVVVAGALTTAVLVFGRDSDSCRDSDLGCLTFE
jgi:hypothetical protein